MPPPIVTVDRVVRKKPTIKWHKCRRLVNGRS
jgi:hypothetical protein